MGNLCYLVGVDKLEWWGLWACVLECVPVGLAQLAQDNSQVVVCGPGSCVVAVDECVEGGRFEPAYPRLSTALRAVTPAVTSASGEWAEVLRDAQDSDGVSVGGDECGG